MQRVWVQPPSYETAVSLLVERRQSLGLSQRDLAAKMGKPYSFVAKVETKGRRLDFVEFVAYAHALGLRPSDLISDVASALGDNIVF
ncbi:MAG: XRE family transcriptional regulator [Brevundimonas sp.]|uniref:helix-turn-helix domain-containing protein n=1 Tax=Brevundimonas sp. TaxID=1871086 RepID=UPI000DB44CD0|nr:helix-turn-helix transcriptional regulator [Brevundimonas sp.]PZT98595.1 MAG: XRE family transcriptional regulator [Brevundimonas sp.]